MKDMNRGAKILICVLVAGILVIGIQQLVSRGPSADKKTADKFSKEINYFNELTKKVELLKSGELVPVRFNSLEIEIDSYFQQELITDQAAASLKTSVNNIFAQRVYRQCEHFLKSANGNNGGNLALLNSLQSKIGTNSTINNLRTQIHWSDYYTKTLPLKVNAFVASGIDNYTEAEYQLLKNEAQNMPGLSPLYSKSAKFSAISDALMKKLFQFNYEYNN